MCIKEISNYKLYTDIFVEIKNKETDRCIVF